MFPLQLGTASRVWFWVRRIRTARSSNQTVVSCVPARTVATPVRRCVHKNFDHHLRLTVETPSSWRLTLAVVVNGSVLTPTVSSDQTTVIFVSTPAYIRSNILYLNHAHTGQSKGGRGGTAFPHLSASEVPIHV